VGRRPAPVLPARSSAPRRADRRAAGRSGLAPPRAAACSPRRPAAAADGRSPVRAARAVEARRGESRVTPPTISRLRRAAERGQEAASTRGCGCAIRVRSLAASASGWPPGLGVRAAARREAWAALRHREPVRRHGRSSSARRPACWAPRREAPRPSRRAATDQAPPTEMGPRRGPSRAGGLRCARTREPRRAPRGRRSRRAPNHARGRSRPNAGRDDRRQQSVSSSSIRARAACWRASVHNPRGGSSPSLRQILSRRRLQLFDPGHRAGESPLASSRRPSPPGSDGRRQPT
jgi:hypothetical protein